MQAHQDLGGMYWSLSKVILVVIVSIIAFILVIAMGLIMINYDGLMELFL
jgi:hypothetical protein